MREDDAGSRAAHAERIMRIGCIIVALALIPLGAICVYTGDFAYTWQPVPEGWPARETAARVTGLALILVGILLLVPRLLREATVAAFVLFAAWLVLLHVPKLIRGENWLGFFEFLLPVGAAFALLALLAARHDLPRRIDWAHEDVLFVLARLSFGIGLIGCGASHFVYAQAAADMIPAWMPGRLFWTYLTGAGHIAAGLSLSAGVLMRFAAPLLCFMLASFIVLLHVPRVLADPTSRHEWTMLLVAGLFNGGAWILTGSVLRKDAAQKTRESTANLRVQTQEASS